MMKISHAGEIRDVSTPEQRETEMNVVHIVGERTEEQAVYRIPLSLQFESDLSSHEVSPVIGVHSTIRKAPRIGYTRFPVVWEKGKDGKTSITHKMIVYVGMEAPWPHDASIVVQMFANIKSSEGVYRLEKTGAACLPLNKLIEPTKDPIRALVQAELSRSSPPKEEEETDRAVYAMPLVLQSARMLLDKPFYKGKIKMMHKYGTIAKRNPDTGKWSYGVTITKSFFAKETTWDAVDNNISFIERRIMRAVNKSMSPFVPEVVKMAKIEGGFEPTTEPINRVHFPFFVTEVSAVPGDTYFSNYASESDYDHRLYTSLIHIALERRHMSPKEFVSVGQAFITGKLEKVDTDNGGIKYDTRLTKTSSVFVEACTIIATSVPYIGDYIDFNEDRTRKTPFNAQKSHISTESCDDAVARGADDCEGVTKVTTRVYTGFRDMDVPKDNKILQVANAIANHYICMGALGSVTSRNLAESEGKSSSTGDSSSRDVEGMIEIDSEEDKSAQIGAHMWAMFFPKRHALKLFEKTWNNPRCPLRWTDNTQATDYPEWNERLPVLVGEGTGMLDPELAPKSAYESGIESKRMVISEDIKKRDAMARLMFGVTIKEMEGVSPTGNNFKIEKPGELAKLQMQKYQEEFMENRNARLSSFYRRITAFFPIVTKHEEFSPDMFAKAEVDVPERWCNTKTLDFLDKTGAPVYSWRAAIPVQMDKDRPKEWKAAFDSPGKQHEFVMKNLHWGVNIEDFIYKRDHVAIMRMPGNTIVQQKAIGSAMRHLPPLAALDYLNEKQMSDVNMMMASLNKSMKRELIKQKGEGNFLRLDHSAFETSSSMVGDVPVETVHLYIRSQDLTSEQAKRIIKRTAESKYVMSARFVSEIVTPSVGSIRLEAVINNSDHAQLNEGDGSGFKWFTDKPIY